ncbi:MAG: flagellar assembly protein FliW [Desulfobacteraceae bacterium]|nr:flagellar assembly protein FliW [Desulfobacteraceae bacterium]
MEIETSRFGRMEIDPERIITFTRGMLGFSAQKRYILFPHKEGSSFYWLQSVDDPWLAFVVISPDVFCSDYEFELKDQVLQELKIERPEQVLVLVTVTVPKGNPGGLTANLLGPVVINMDERLACQVILDPAVYPVAFPVVPSLEAKVKSSKAGPSDARKGSGRSMRY